MNITNNYSVKFGSTRIPYKTKKPVLTPIKRLRKDFKLVYFKNQAQCAKSLQNGQAGILMDDMGMRIMGRNYKADKKINNMLKDIPGAEYIDDKTIQIIFV